MSALPASGSRRTSCFTSRPLSRWRCATISVSRRRANSVKLRILETDREGPLLAATFNGRRRALTTAALLRSFFSLPLVTFKIVAAIHWEALRLWLKGARLVPRPSTAAANADTGLASGERAAIILSSASCARSGPSEGRGSSDRCRELGHRATALVACHAERDLGHARQCGNGAFRSAPPGSAGARLRLEAAGAARSTSPCPTAAPSGLAATSRARRRP